MHLGCETVDDVGKARLVASCAVFEVPVADGARTVTTAEEDDLTLILFPA